jgi:hypothetical protein
MLVSCSLCRRLHEPVRPLDLNPVCPLCASALPDDRRGLRVDAEREF